MNYNLLFNRLAIGLAFIIPLSIAGYNLILAALVLTWILEAKWKEKWKIIKAQPVFKAMLIYFIFAVLSLLWTENIPSGLHYVKQYYIFFLLPILYTSIDRSRIPEFFSAFLAAMIISEIFSYLIYFDLMPFKLKSSWSSLDPSPFMMHTMYSLFLILAIFIMLLRLAYKKENLLQKIFYSLFIITMTLNLFINSGRTGQFAFLLALLVFVYLYYQIHWLKSIIIAFFTGGLIFLIAYTVSPNFKNRTDETLNSIKYTWDRGEALDDSLGLRFMMWQVASDIIVQHPIIGTGIGDERDSYMHTLTYKFPNHVQHIDRFTDLHNTYLKVLVSTGIIGLLLYLSIFYYMLRELDKSKELYPIGGVLIVTLLQYMIVGNFPAAHLTVIFIFIISLTLKHPLLLSISTQKDS